MFVAEKDGGPALAVLFPGGADSTARACSKEEELVWRRVQATAALQPMGQTALLVKEEQAMAQASGLTLRV
jgi:hypothetical protein